MFIMSSQSTPPSQPMYPQPEEAPELDDVFSEPDFGTGVAPSAAAEEPMPHVEYTYSPESFVCVRCGSKNLADGYIIDYGDKFEQVHFAPKRVTLRFLN